MIPAFEPWLPQYIDLVKRKEDGDPNYQNVGFDALDVDSSLENIDDRWEVLEQRFTERYAFRRISAETLTRWQVRLQNRFDEIADRYERAYALYAENGAAMMDDILPGWKEIMDRTDKDSGTDTNTRTGSREISYAGSREMSFEGSKEVSRAGTETDTKRFADTPDSSTNASDMYADRREESTHAFGAGRKDTESFNQRKDTESFNQRKDTETFNQLKDALLHGKTTDIDYTLTRTETGAQIIDAVNEAITKWKDLDTQFVAEFENLFLNIFDY